MWIEWIYPIIAPLVGTVAGGLIAIWAAFRMEKYREQRRQREIHMAQIKREVLEPLTINILAVCFPILFGKKELFNDTIDRNSRQMWNKVGGHD